MADIFISYKREERAIAKTFADALTAHGWSVWWDQDLRVGERFDDVIEAAIRDCRCLVVLWTRLSVQSKYIKDESGLALELGKLLPIAIEDVDLPFRFRSLHTLQVVGWDGSSGSPQHVALLSGVKRFLGDAPLTAREHGQVGKATIADLLEEARAVAEGTPSDAPRPSSKKPPVPTGNKRPLGTGIKPAPAPMATRPLGSIAAPIKKKPSPGTR